MKKVDSCFKKRFKKIFSLLVLSALSFPLFSGIVLSQEDISQYERRLTEISKKIDRLKKKIKQTGKEESSILAQLERITFKKKLINNEIILYQTQIKKANIEVSETKKDISQLKDKLKKNKKNIEKILVTLYKFGKLNYVEFMLQAENIGNLISENKYLTILAQYQEGLIKEYLKTLDELEAAQAKLEAKKKEITKFIQISNLKKEELESQEKKNKSLITEIKRNKNTYSKIMEELKERARQLEKLIKKISKEKIALPFPLIPLYEKKGKLSWPIKGKLINLFGLEKHPRFNTITISNGIEILPENNIIVNSIHPGKIVYSDYFQGYGDLIIIDHGMDYYSLYGHCSDFLLKKGDFVNTNQPIAVVGKTLYFELRFKTKPLNPLKWLKKR